MVSSDNTVYAQLTDIVGPKEIVKTAHALGIKSPLDAYFSIGLGSGAVNPLEMTRAYATIANGGRRVDGTIFGDRPRVVERVERIRANRVEENAPRPDAGDRFRPGRGAHRHPSGRRLRAAPARGRASPGRSVAGKTGTTDNYADAWFVGYTPELAVAVWVGYPDRLRPMLTEFGGEPVTGGTLPAQIWKEFVSSLEESDENASFDYAPYLGGVSTWVVKREGEWQLDNGVCRGSRVLVYFSDELPGTTADCKPNEVQVPLVVGMAESVAVARLKAQPLEATRGLRAGEGGPSTGSGRRPGSSRRRSLGGRLGAPLRDGRAPRARSELRRLEPCEPRAARSDAFGSSRASSPRPGRWAWFSARASMRASPRRRG